MDFPYVFLNVLLLGNEVLRGMAADIDPRLPGYEMWGGTRNRFNVKGEDMVPGRVRKFRS